MGEIVSTIFDSVGGVIKGITGAIKEAAAQLIYTDPTAAEPELSVVFQFGLVFLGISIATGIGYMLFRMIRNR